MPISWRPSGNKELAASHTNEAARLLAVNRQMLTASPAHMNFKSFERLDDGTEVLIRSFRSSMATGQAGITSIVGIKSPFVEGKIGEKIEKRTPEEKEFLYLHIYDRSIVRMKLQKIKPSTGETLWEVTLPYDNQDIGRFSNYNHSAYSIFAYKEHVYVEVGYNLQKYDKDGKLIWTSAGYTPGLIMSVKCGEWGVAALCRNYSGAYVVKFDPLTGATLWTNKIDGEDDGSYLFEEVWDFTTIDGDNFYVSGIAYTSDDWYQYPVVYKVTSGSKSLIYEEPSYGIANHGKWYWRLLSDSSGIYIFSEAVIPGLATCLITKINDNGLLWETLVFPFSMPWPAMTFSLDGKSIYGFNSEYNLSSVAKVSVEDGEIIGSYQPSFSQIWASVADTSKGLFLSTRSLNSELVKIEVPPVVVWQRSGLNVVCAASARI